MYELTEVTAWRVTSTIVFFANALAAVEKIYAFRETYSNTGILSHRMLRAGRLFVKTVWRRDYLLSTLYIQVFFSFLGMAMVIQEEVRPLAGLIALVVVCCRFYETSRNRGLAAEGSDQLSTIALITFAVWAQCNRGTLASNACTAFLAIQVVFSYFVAGVAKLMSAQWRSGDALASIAATRTYRSRIMLSAPKVVRLTIAWIVIGFEVLFPLGLLSQELCSSLLAIGLIFHIGTAWVMGLNLFLLVFPGSYFVVYSYVSTLQSGQ